MSPTKVICEFRVKRSESDDGNNQSLHEAVLLSLSDCRHVSIETRQKWAIGVMEHIGQGSELNSIRPWEFVAQLDGSVESLATPISKSVLSEGYPARFQIPHSTLHGLEIEEKVKRAEKFAMASLLYEIMSGRKPFEGNPIARCKTASPEETFQTTPLLRPYRYSFCQVGVRNSRRRLQKQVC